MDARPRVRRQARADARSLSIRIAIAQCAPALGAVKRNVDMHRSWIARAKAAGADGEVQRVLVIALEIFTKLRLVRIEPSRHTDDDRIRLRDFQIPEVVFHPRAGFHDDGADNAGRPGQRLVQTGQRCFGLSAIFGRAHIAGALRPGAVKQMDMRVDDGDRVDAGAEFFRPLRPAGRGDLFRRNRCVRRRALRDACDPAEGRGDHRRGGSRRAQECAAGQVAVVGHVILRIVSSFSKARIAAIDAATTLPKTSAENQLM